MFDHFILLDINKVNFPFFIFNSLAILVEKVQNERASLPLHGAIIKFVTERGIALSPNKLPKVKVLVGGNVFELGKKAKVGEYLRGKERREDQEFGSHRMEDNLRSRSPYLTR